MYTLDELELIELSLYRLSECEDMQHLESKISKLVNKVVNNYLECYKSKK